MQKTDGDIQAQEAKQCGSQKSIRLTSETNWQLLER
jgi:hypothetical protein